MPGWRQLHDDVPHSRTLGNLSDQAERLYMRMLSVTDQWGRLTGDLHKLRVVAIPTLPWDDDKLGRAVDELRKAGAIDHHATDGIDVIELVNFDQRQAFAKKRRQPSRYPARNATSLSPEDLALPLPLLTDQPETPSLPNGELEACGLRLSTGDLREPVPKTPAPTDEHKTETEDRRESPSPTAVARPAGEILSIGKQIEASLEQAASELPPLPLAFSSPAVFADSGGVAGDPEDLRALAAQLAGADAGTVHVLAKLRRRGLPQAAFAVALESLRERRSRADLPPVRNEVRFVVGALKTMLREGKYEKEEAA